MARTLLASLVFAVSFAALAQPGPVADGDLSRGVNLGTTLGALSDDARGIPLNPATLHHQGQAQLFFLHERSLTRDLVGDGLYLGDTLGDAVGLGFSVEWLRSQNGVDRRRTAGGISLGGRKLSLGATLAAYESDESSSLSQLTSLDLGLSSRPIEQLSVSVAVRNVDEPSRGGIVLPRQFDVSVGVRPLGERFGLGAGYLLNDGERFADGRLQYVLQAEVLRGLVLGAGVSHGLRQSRENLALQLSLTFNGAHAGAGYTIGGTSGGTNHLLGVRVSSDAYSAFNTSNGRIAVLDLGDLLSADGSPALALLGIGPTDPYLRFTRLLDAAAKDDSLRGVLLKIDGIPETGLGKAEELRQAILRLRGAGKQVYALLLSAEDTEYHLATACDRIFAVPEATLMINGLSGTVTSLGGTMEKLGVTWDVARSGPYKTAPEAFTRTEMSDAQRETMNAYLDVQSAAYFAAVTSGRQIGEDKLRAAFRKGLIVPRDAKELGLIDEVVDLKTLEETLRSNLPGVWADGDYRPRYARDRRWGTRKQVALIPVVGNITGGKSRSDPFGAGEIAGAETVISAVTAAANDPDIAAIVLRIDSGGGDGLASDLIYRAVMEAKAKKPVVASMGDVAASGGYMAAMGADEIFASSTTITGSIGVFILKPAIRGLGEKLGVERQTITRGNLPNLLSVYEPWSDEEQLAAQAWVDAFYDDFIGEVAVRRGLSKEQVNEIARGRVWAGADAYERKLVDQLGGIHEAIASAKKRAGILEDEDVELRIIGEPKGLFASMGGDGAVSKLVGSFAVETEPNPFGALAKELGLSEASMKAPTVQAALPYTIRVR